MDGPIQTTITFVPGYCSACGGETNTVKIYDLKDRYNTDGHRIAWCKDCSMRLIGYLSESWGVQMEVVRPEPIQTKRKKKANG